MSIHAGSILHVGGKNIIDRIQSAGLGNTDVAMNTIREVGNPLIVDKVPGDPDFTFSLESFDASSELEAMLNGKVGTGPGAGAGPGAVDADGTEYKWQDCKAINILSPWKDPVSGSAGTINAGHIVPGFYPTRISYRFGVTDNASQTVDLSGGSFYYGQYSPMEDYFAGDGAAVAFVLTDNAIGYRIGGSGGTTFQRVFGVLVDGVLQSHGIDYTESGPATAASSPVTVTFTVAPRTGADIRVAYFTDAVIAWPDTDLASTTVKPGAVRGRNICVYLGSGVGRVKIGGVQALTLDATVDGANTREFCNTEVVGREVNGTDCTGSVTFRAKDRTSFLALLSKVTGVAVTEVFGWLNTNEIPLTVQIQNPKAPGTILKTLAVKNAVFQMPGTPARVNTPTDFVLNFADVHGTYSAFKGGYLP